MPIDPQVDSQVGRAIAGDTGRQANPADTTHPTDIAQTADSTDTARTANPASTTASGTAATDHREHLIRTMLKMDGIPSGTQLIIHEGLASARERWADALAHGVAYGFQTFEWADAWQRTIGQAEGVRALVADLRDSAGRTVMLWPLAIHREGRLRVLRFLGGVVTDYNAPIIDPQFVQHLAPGAIDRLWEAVLKALPRVDLVWLRRMPAVIEGVVNPMTQLAQSRHTENAYAATLPDTAEAFKASRSPKHFADARRQLRRLNEIAPVVMIERASGDQAAELTAVMAVQKSRRWHESNGRDLFAEPGYLEFYQSLAAGPQAWSDTAVCGLQVGQTTVATHWGIIFRGRHYWLMPGYEAGEWGKFSSGRLLMQHMIDWSIAQGLTVFDLTVGDEDYKKAWADHTLDLHEWVSPRTPAGWVPVLKRRARDWARTQPALVNLVRRLRRAP